MSYKKAKGTIDFFPDEMSIRNQVFSVLRNTANKFGFKEIEAPAFENMDLLTAKSGDEIKTQIFNLEKKSDEEFGLRFDLTVPFTRMFIEKQKQVPKPVKWFGLTRMWRYERPQAGRLREFYQLSVELFGSDKPEADAEIINLVVAILKNLGLTETDFVVKINNRLLLKGIILDILGSSENEDEVIRAIDKKSKISDENFKKELKLIGLNKTQIEKLTSLLELDLENLEKESLNDESKEGLIEIKSIMKYLDKKSVKFDLSLARGLAYYTGTVFEVFDKKGKYRAIAGGGRYDNLVGLFDGEECPATGFGMGYSTLSLLLQDRKLLPKSQNEVDYYIVPISQEYREEANNLATQLREKYSVDIDLMQRNMAKQMKYANSIGAKNVIFIGEDEIKKKVLKVKDMLTGKEKSVKMEALLK